MCAGQVDPRQGRQTGDLLTWLSKPWTTRISSFPTGDFELIASIAREQAGIVIRAHKSAMIRGRLHAAPARAATCARFASTASFCAARSAGTELPQLLNVLTTNHTAFFRERHHFDHMRERRPAGDVLAGQPWQTQACASGAPPPRQARNPIRLQAWSMQ